MGSNNCIFNYCYCDGYLPTQDKILTCDPTFVLSGFIADDIIMISNRHNKITISFDYGFIHILY